MRKMIALVLGLVFVFGFVNVASAASTTTPSGSTRSEEFCQRVQRVVGERKTKVEAGAVTRSGYYKERIQKWKDFAVKAKSLGVDTTVFEGYIAETEVRYQKAIAAYTDLATKLKGVLAVDCSNRDNVKSAMNEVRAQRRVAFQARADLNKYIRVTVRPGLKTLLEQIRAKIKTTNTTK